MRKYLLVFLLLSLNCIFPSDRIYAQNFTTAFAYLNYINRENNDISKSMWGYLNAAAHAKKGRTIDNRRKALIRTIDDVRNKIAAMPDFKGDASLRDTVVSFLKLQYLVLNEDYDKILNMEEIAEQSYDLMEAYMLAKEKADEKLEIASDIVDKQVRVFASANNIKLSEEPDKLGKKLELAGEVFDYYNSVYLIFFKSYKQELYLMDALIKTDLNAIEQNKNALIQTSTEGLGKIASVTNFKGDGSLKTSCNQVLKFYKQEAEQKMDILSDFYIKKENFEKLKTSFDSKDQMARTQDEVNQYNAAVKSFNDATMKFNRTNDELNNSRKRFLDAWNNSIDSFLQRQIPEK
jgi:hypothetical protein